MANDILHALFAASLIVGAVILLLVGARGQLRRAFGARVAYLAWAAVPAALLAMASASFITAHAPTKVRR